MRRRCHRWVMLAAIALLVAACGQSDPTFAPAGRSDASPVQSATPEAPATPTAPIAASGTPDATPATTAVSNATPAGTETTSRPSADWIDLPADFTVRTAAQAEALALDLAPTTLDASHPYVARTWLLTQREMAQGTNQVLGENDDPLALVWWVDLDDDDYVIPRCPAPLPGTMRKNCGSAPLAAFQFFASDGQNLGLTVGRNFAPTSASSDISIPPDARLRTEGEAIAAALQMVPGADGHLPHVVDLRLIGVQQWMHEEAERGAISYLGLAPDTPLWEVELTNAAYSIPCMSLVPSACKHEHDMFLFDALTGASSGVYSPPPASSTPKP